MLKNLGPENSYIRKARRLDAVKLEIRRVVDAVWESDSLLEGFHDW